MFTFPTCLIYDIRISEDSVVFISVLSETKIAKKQEKKEKRKQKKKEYDENTEANNNAGKLILIIS